MNNGMFTFNIFAQWHQKQQRHIPKHEFVNCKASNNWILLFNKMYVVNCVWGNM